jgi:diaminopimelate epimerase
MRGMASGNFVKMHGLGNDFVIIDGRAAPVQLTVQQIRAVADRRQGIGCDQLILLEPSDLADVKMCIFNSDGSEAEACGNAARCVVAMIGADCTIETSGGVIAGTLGENAVTIDMGKPRFEWHHIPLAFAMDTSALPMAWDGLSAPMAVNVGNPHVIFFVPDCDAVDLATLGPLIENDAAFPAKINVNIASVAADGIKLHVWERGAGLTRACGTGACATAVAAISKGLVSSPVVVNLPGGALSIAWQPGGTVVMTGGTALVFTGTANWDDFT